MVLLPAEGGIVELRPLIGFGAARARILDFGHSLPAANNFRLSIMTIAPRMTASHFGHFAKLAIRLPIAERNERTSYVTQSRVECIGRFVPAATCAPLQAYRQCRCRDV